MGANTHIQWCDHSFNPWEGCTKVSPGCANCYAERRNTRFGGGTAPNWGKGKSRRRTSANYWLEPLRWNRLGGPDGRRPRVFCASLADWLDEEVPIEWLADLLKLIHETPNLDWLLLTKRPENWRTRLEACDGIYPETTNSATPLTVNDMICNWVYDGIAPANVWVGTSVENQKAADERVPVLLSIPAAVRFLSCEPMLWHVDIARFTSGAGIRADRSTYSIPGIDWVICGGESGPNARPINPDWARSLRDQCAAAGVPFFFKQWGEWAPSVAELKPYNSYRPQDYRNGLTWCSDGKTVGNSLGTRWINLTVPDEGVSGNCRFHDGDVLAFKVGKKAAGNMLDGAVHDAFPNTQGES